MMHAVPAGGTLLTVREDVSITRIDADNHPVVGQVAAASSELVALTLWLCAERLQGSASSNAAFLATLPVSLHAQRNCSC